MSPFVQPTNAILLGITPNKEACIAENTGASDDLKPGMFVITGTAPQQVKYAGAGAVNCLGVADYDERFKITDAYVEGEEVTVLKPPCLVLVTLATGQSVVKGDKLICAANGEAQEFPAVPAAGDEEKIVAVAEETVDATAAALPILVRLV